MPHLCMYMPKSKNARHLIPDPDNEPDFYRLSKVFPLGDQEKEIEIPSMAKDKPDESSSIPAAGQREISQKNSVSSVAAGALPAPSVGASPMLAPHQTNTSSVLTASSLLRQHQMINQAAAVDQATFENDAMILRAAALRESLKHWRTGGFLF